MDQILVYLKLFEIMLVEIDDMREQGLASGKLNIRFFSVLRNEVNIVNT